jgi:hypothetical protein
MRHLILAASLTLIAAPAFAETARDAGKAPEQTALSTTAPQQHTYSYSSDGDSSSNIEIRNDRLRRNAMARSPNAKAAWAGQPHFY